MKKKLLLVTAIFISGLANSQVTSGLVAKYSFNNGNANDEVGTNNGIVNGATSTNDRFGNIGKAYIFDGVNDLIDLGNTSTFQMGQNDFSVSFWVESTVSQFGPIINKRNDSPNFDQYSINIGGYSSPSNNLAFYYKPSPGGIGALERSYTHNVSSTSWQHIVVIHSFNGSTSMYINNQLAGSSNTAFSTENFNIAEANLIAGFTNVLGTDYYFNGKLDDIAIYNRTLTANEVTSLYNEANPIVSLSTGLIAKYSFNNTNTIDEIGTNDLTAQNGATFGIDRFGNINKATLLDGSDDYLRTTNPFFYPGNDFSISLWYKSNNVAQSRQTFFNTEPHQQISVGYNWFGDGSYDIALNDGTSWNICSNAANGLDTFFVMGVTSTNWNHFTMTYNGATWNSYINNNLVNTCNTGTPTSVISDLFFGSISVGPQSFFAGLLDDIWIYDRALIPAEVTALYNEQNPMTVGISENGLMKYPIVVFPNPNNGEFTIQSQKADLVNITNELGQVIETIELNQQNNFSYQINNLSTGIYFLIGKSIEQKVIVTH